MLRMGRGIRRLLSHNLHYIQIHITINSRSMEAAQTFLTPRSRHRQLRRRPLA